MKSNAAEPLFEKMIWLGAGVSGRLDVRYRRLDASTTPVTAQTIPGQLSGYSGPSWAARMYFDAGCWEIRGRVADATLSFIVRVAGS